MSKSKPKPKQPKPLQNGQITKSPKKFLSPGDPVPENIHWEWLEIVQAIQAACAENGGFGQMNVTVSVHKNKPVFWTPAHTVGVKADEVGRPGYRLLKLSPARVAEFRMSSEVAASLMALHDE